MNRLEELRALQNYADTQVFQLDLDSIRQSAYDVLHCHPDLREIHRDFLRDFVGNAIEDGIPLSLIKTEIRAGRRGFGVTTRS